jgi:hypothetical protein
VAEYLDQLTVDPQVQSPEPDFDFAGLENKDRVNSQLGKTDDLDVRRTYS